MPPLRVTDLQPGNYWPFVLWLLGFYACWLVIVVAGNHWQAVAAHWPMAFAMLLGSYVAGSTPMGGGTVGFPVLVLLFDMPSSMGRNFGLAIQSIGMVSASIHLFCGRRRLAMPVLKPAILGATLGTPLGAVFVAPAISDLGVKLAFAVVWASFGLLLMLRWNDLLGNTDKVHFARARHRMLGLLVGILGGIVASVTGVGIDMMIYVLLVLVDRADLKVAIPTSVVLMAYTSVIGIITNMLLSQTGAPAYAMNPDLLYSWLAAAPVVALGAPLGSWVVSRVPPAPTLVLVCGLCLTQFVWTIWVERITGWMLLATLLAVLVANLAFLWLNALGLRLHQAQFESTQK